MARDRFDGGDVRARLLAAERAAQAAQPAAQELPTTVEVVTLHNVLVDIAVRPSATDGQLEHVIIVRKLAQPGHKVEAIEVPLPDQFARRLIQRWDEQILALEALAEGGEVAGAAAEA